MSNFPNIIPFNHEFSGSLEKSMLLDAIPTAAYNANEAARCIYEFRPQVAVVDREQLNPHAVSHAATKVVELAEHETPSVETPKVDDEQARVEWINHLIDEIHESAA